MGARDPVTTNWQAQDYPEFVTASRPVFENLNGVGSQGPSWTRKQILGAM